MQPHVKGQRPGEEGGSPSGQEERGREPQLEDHRPDRKQHREGVLLREPDAQGNVSAERVLQGAALQGVAVHPAQPAEYQLRGAGGEIHQREEQVRQRERPAREGDVVPGRPARPPFPPRVQREILVAGRERQRHQEEREHRLGMVYVAIGEPVRHEEPGPQREQRHHHPGEEPDQRQQAEGHHEPPDHGDRAGGEPDLPREHRRDEADQDLGMEEAGVGLEPAQLLVERGEQPEDLCRDGEDPREQPD